ncbi:MAG: ankyrin repeat domain-containing protein [Chthonomonadales bacterium]
MDLDNVKLLLEKHPAVLNATVDWGGGDWESGLGGASHMGRRDIAEFLIEKGARIDIFAATMLGHLDIVKSLLALHPTLIDAKGPHGIPLLAHAKMGGKEAEAVFHYIESLKAAKPPLF